MFPESGRKVPEWVLQLTPAQLAEHIGTALRSELGTSRRATKTVMSWSGACDRAARTWINGGGGVSGVHLLHLARQSDAVWRMVLDLSARHEAALGFEVHAAEVALSKALGAIEVLKRQVSFRA